MSVAQWQNACLASEGSGSNPRSRETNSLEAECYIRSFLDAIYNRVFKLVDFIKVKNLNYVENSGKKTRGKDQEHLSHSGDDTRWPAF